jgi:hypothetical protein
MYFRRGEIYSYGEHFLAAKKHEAKKRLPMHSRVFVLINSKNYSNTTAKHLGKIWSACNNYIPAFSCSDPRDIKLAVKEATQAIKNWETYALKKKKVTDRYTVDFYLTEYSATVAKCNELRELCGYKKIKEDIKSRARIAAHLNERLARFQELNKPEILEKKRLEKEKRENEKQAENVAKWRAGEYVSLRLPYQILRVRENVVETSGGARVPLGDALDLFKLLNTYDKQSANVFKGYLVGNYEFNNFDGETITIGCHRIKLEEARTVLGGMV